MNPKRKFRVLKSTDTSWVSWAVVGYGRDTEWFRSEAEAQKRADELNEKHELAQLWEGRPCE